MNYERAWNELRKKLKAFNEITSFHGLSFKRPIKILVTTVLKWMEELEDDNEDID